MDTMSTFSTFCSPPPPPPPSPPLTLPPPSFKPFLSPSPLPLVLPPSFSLSLPAFYSPSLPLFHSVCVIISLPISPIDLDIQQTMSYLSSVLVSANMWCQGWSTSLGRTLSTETWQLATFLYLRTKSARYT